MFYGYIDQMGYGCLFKRHKYILTRWCHGPANHRSVVKQTVRECHLWRTPDRIYMGKLSHTHQRIRATN